MSDDAVRRLRAKVGVHDMLKGYALPLEFRNSKPIVTWYCANCVKQKHRVLRLYLSPQASGWYLHGENYKIALPEWLKRVAPDSPEAFDTYRQDELHAINPRRVSGMETLLPLDVSHWAKGAKFTGGCKRCGESVYNLDDLAEDATEARKTWRAVQRYVRKSSGL